MSTKNRLTRLFATTATVRLTVRRDARADADHRDTGNPPLAAGLSYDLSHPFLLLHDRSSADFWYMNGLTARTL